MPEMFCFGLLESFDVLQLAAVSVRLADPASIAGRRGEPASQHKAEIVLLHVIEVIRGTAVEEEITFTVGWKSV